MACRSGGKRRVVASDPGASLLVDKIDNAAPSCGVRMPPSGPLTAAQIKQIKDWIAAGAKND
jgi:hypothetical protein